MTQENVSSPFWTAWPACSPSAGFEISSRKTMAVKMMAMAMKAKTKESQRRRLSHEPSALCLWPITDPSIQFPMTASFLLPTTSCWYVDGRFSNLKSPKEIGLSKKMLPSV